MGCILFGRARFLKFSFREEDQAGEREGKVGIGCQKERREQRGSYYAIEGW